MSDIELAGTAAVKPSLDAPKSVSPPRPDGATPGVPASRKTRARKHRAYFAEHRGELRLRWPVGTEPALREAQVGAILALSGHLATSREPGQAILPTGVGKTAVICALPYLVPTTRMLVVVPTRLLRDQIAEAFETLSDLRRFRVTGKNLGPPAVTRVEHRLGSVDDWLALNNADVVVGTTAVVAGDGDNVALPPRGLFDLVVFDEAHHLPATTWTTVLNQHDARFALVTATPFRRDRKLLPGRLAYYYPMRQAIGDGVYAEVQFVSAATGADGNADQAVAEKAVQILRTEEHQREGSLLLVRTDRVTHARELVDVYADLGLAIGLITGDQSGTQVKDVIAKLRSGALAGVASVGALVEGFDLPALKVAAYHRPHRSLAATLQFVGRIARVRPGNAKPQLVAVPDQIASEVSELYAEDAAWRNLLPNLNDTAVARVRDARDYDLGFRDVGVPNLASISPSAIRPPKMVQVFRTVGQRPDLSTTIKRLSRADVVFQSTDENSSLLALVTRTRSRPEWLASNALDYDEYQLYVVVHDEKLDLTFVAAPTDVAARDLCSLLGIGEPHLVTSAAMAQWFWKARLEGYSSVGMRATRLGAALDASYKTVAGRSAQRAIMRSDSRNFAAGHLIARRLDANGSVGVGMSVRRAKVWESTPTESLLDFRDWCFSVGIAMSDRSVIRSDPDLNLNLPQALDRFPKDPIGLVHAHELLNAKVEVTGEDRLPVVLLAWQISRSDTYMEVAWLHKGSEQARHRFDVSGGVTPVGDRNPTVTIGGESTTLNDLLQEYAPAFFFGDGSSTDGPTLLVPDPQMPRVPSSVFVTWDFSKTDIRAEAKARKAATDKSKETIQGTALRYIRDMQPSVVLIDDGAGEIADIVVVQTASQPEVHLFHLKFSSKDKAGARLKDLYEVLGQAVRSAQWTQSAACWSELDRRAAKRSYTRVVGNDADAKAALAQLATRPPGLNVTIWVVQPGVSLAKLTKEREANVLLLWAMEWCNQQGARFRFVGGA